jgi:hypothetical protein
LILQFAVVQLLLQVRRCSHLSWRRNASANPIAFYFSGV